MAGHNKWSKIKRKKGANDVARAAAFSKAAKAIQVASRACSGDETNLSLQSAIASAKAIQLPKDRIADAIRRGIKGSSGGEGDELMPIRYDAMVPTSSKSGSSSHRVALIIMTLTDNRNRTLANVKAILRKLGGELVPTGTNDWLFEHVGVILVPKTKQPQPRQQEDDDIIVNEEKENENEKKNEFSEEELFDLAISAGANDIDFGSNDSDQQHAFIQCDPKELHKLVETLRLHGYAPDQFETRFVIKDESNALILDNTDDEEDDDEDINNGLERVLEKLEEDEDVLDIYHNAIQ